MLLVGVVSASVELGDEVVDKEDVEIAGCLVQVPEKATVRQVRLNRSAVLHSNAGDGVGSRLHRGREDVSDTDSRSDQMAKFQPFAQDGPAVPCHRDQPEAFFEAGLVVFEDSVRKISEDALRREKRFILGGSGRGNRGIRFVNFHRESASGNVRAPASCREVVVCR